MPKSLVQFLKGPKFRNTCIAIIVGLLLFSLLFLMYFTQIHPLIVFFLPDTSWCQGLEYYNNQAYLQYSDGNQFKQVLESNGCLDWGQVIDFCYVDNHLHDNPIYGKCGDVYSVDIQMAENIYTDIRADIIDSAKRCADMGVYKLYLTDYDAGEANDYLLYALCESAYIIRCILLTDHQQYSEDVLHFTFYFPNRSPLNWHCPYRNNPYIMITEYPNVYSIYVNGSQLTDMTAFVNSEINSAAIPFKTVIAKLGGSVIKDTTSETVISFNNFTYVFDYFRNTLCQLGKTHNYLYLPRDWHHGGTYQYVNEEMYIDNDSLKSLFEELGVSIIIDYDEEAVYVTEKGQYYKTGDGSLS